MAHRGPERNRRSEVHGTAAGLTYAGGMRFSVLVETRPRVGVADPEGATIERSLPALGFEGVSGVRVGKAFRFTLEAEDAAAARAQVADMCQRFLTNPVIEDAEVTVDEQVPV
jgi:phosphoribosylformylglycinamidine synthase PurS subunit